MYINTNFSQQQKMTIDSSELVEPEIIHDVLMARKAKLEVEAISLNQNITLAQNDINFLLNKISNLEVQKKDLNYSLYRVKKELLEIDEQLKD